MKIKELLHGLLRATVISTCGGIGTFFIYMVAFKSLILSLVFSSIFSFLVGAYIMSLEIQNYINRMKGGIKQNGNVKRRSKKI